MVSGEKSKVCSVDVWLMTFLGALLVFSYASTIAPAPYEWVMWPVTVSLCSAMVSAVTLEVAVWRLPTPQSLKGLRRAILYVACFVIGIILIYAITPIRIGSRGFRISIFLVFGLPLFVWLVGHTRKHHEAMSRRILGICTLAMAVLYLFAALVSPTE
jgi:hypothetical protein